MTCEILVEVSLPAGTGKFRPRDVDTGRLVEAGHLWVVLERDDGAGLLAIPRFDVAGIRTVATP